MASTPTKNPVPSENYDDLRFNAGKLDEFVTSSDDNYTDRLGITHLTARGLQNSVVGALLPANNLDDLENKDESLSNLGGTTVGIAVFKAGTMASARTAIAAAASGENNDITSLSGLTTALSIAQGGTGSTTASGARANLALGSIATQASNSVNITGGSISGIAGVTDGSNASAGKVGEFLSATTVTPVALTTAVAANAISITLTPGDWELKGLARFNPSAAAITQVSGSWNTTSATFAGFPDNHQVQGLTASVGNQIPLPHRRYNVTTNTVVYLVALAVFASGTCTAQGYIEARRVR